LSGLFPIPGLLTADSGLGKNRLLIALKLQEAFADNDVGRAFFFFVFVRITQCRVAVAVFEEDLGRGDLVALPLGVPGNGL
jgi:hypothetical protein